MQVMFNRSQKELSMSEDIAVAIKDRDTKNRIAATGSIIGAILASSCCIVPLVLVTLGASGAWIGNLAVLEPYKPYFAAVTFVFLGFGYWQVYRKPKIACEEGSYCASPASDRITKGTLWIATILVLLALTIDFWAPLFY
jgi:mercuric ion transport protein